MSDTSIREHFTLPSYNNKRYDLLLLFISRLLLFFVSYLLPQTSIVYSESTYFVPLSFSIHRYKQLMLARLLLQTVYSLPTSV